MCAYIPGAHLIGLQDIGDPDDDLEDDLDDDFEDDEDESENDEDEEGGEETWQVSRSIPAAKGPAWLDFGR